MCLNLVSCRGAAWPGSLKPGANCRHHWKPARLRQRNWQCEPRRARSPIPPGATSLPVSTGARSNAAPRVRRARGRTSRSATSRSAGHRATPPLGSSWAGRAGAPASSSSGSAPTAGSSNASSAGDRARSIARHETSSGATPFPIVSSIHRTAGTLLRHLDQSAHPRTSYPARTFSGLPSPRGSDHRAGMSRSLPRTIASRRRSTGRPTS